jgi:restriction system protein
VSTGLQRNGEMVQAVLRVLSGASEGMRAAKVIERVREILPPTPAEEGVYETSGTDKYNKIVRFMTIAPVKAGWIVKSKGIWTITEDGHIALETYSAPAELMTEARKKYYAWLHSREVEPGEIDDVLPENVSSATLEEAEEQSWRDVSSFLAAMPPYEFQDLVAALLKAMGYHIAWVAPPGKDGGIDIIAHIDPLGAQGPRMKVQVKRRADRVGVVELRSFLAVISERDIGVYVSLGGFSSEAQALANQEQLRRLTLLDGELLFDLWIENLASMTAEDKLRMPLKPIYFLNLNPDAS